MTREPERSSVYAVLRCYMAGVWSAYGGLLSWSVECFSKTKWMGVTSPQRSTLERPPACTGQTERRKHVPLSHSRHQTHLHPRGFSLQYWKINLNSSNKPSHHPLKADFEAKIIKFHLYIFGMSVNYAK